MKKITVSILSLFLLQAYSTVVAQTTKPAATVNAAPHKVVEAACGQCQFGLTSKKGCDLAVRIDGKAYFVEGTKIDDHGDAHADDGFCNAVSKAEVAGKVVNGKFVATYFKLIKEPVKKG
ncbi:MAG: hypothetical protein RLY16_835 [Bacteroidota bacterium]|jgi:hypothetical protein